MEITVLFTPKFVKEFQSLEKDLQKEVAEKIELFKDRKNHQILKVHKLHGRLSDRYSFSVDYQNRIVFNFRNNAKTAVFYNIGNHDVYR